MPSVTYKDGQTVAWTGLSRCLCHNCRNLFSSVSAFERHQKRGECRHPATVGLELKGGAWQYPGPAGGLRSALGGAAKTGVAPNTGQTDAGSESADVSAENNGAA